MPDANRSSACADGSSTHLSLSHSSRVALDAPNHLSARSSSVRPRTPRARSTPRHRLASEPRSRSGTRHRSSPAQSCAQAEVAVAVGPRRHPAGVVPPTGQHNVAAGSAVQAVRLAIQHSPRLAQSSLARSPRERLLHFGCTATGHSKQCSVGGAAARNVTTARLMACSVAGDAHRSW